MTDYVKVVADEIYEKFPGAAGETWWVGTPIRDVCSGTLEVGGRTSLTLFASDGERVHPRLRAEPLEVEDSSPLKTALKRSSTIPSTVEGLLKLVGRSTARLASWLAAEELAPADPAAPRPVDCHRPNRVSARRRSQLFGEVRELADRCASAGSWSRAQRDQAAYALAELEWAAHAGEIRFDDEDIGTYFAYTGDKPFVHFLEQILQTLPRSGGEAMAVLSPEQQAAVRRQRDQAVAHLDHLMRRAYAFDGVEEADIERSLGARMVQRRTHRVVSHDGWREADAAAPGYEILRIDPRSEHPNAGAWIHRAGGDLRLDDGTVVEVDPGLVQATPVDERDITFQRAPGDARLRSDICFDWDSNGYITDGPLPGIDWGGFCDAQAMMELSGLTFLGGPGAGGVVEYRADTGEELTYSPALLREMAASVLEAGSAYKDLESREWLRASKPLQGGVGVGDKADRLVFFAPLLHAALVRGEAVIADAHLEEEVWNGVVTRMNARLVDSDADARLERWRIDIDARHGSSTMDFLLTRAADGQPADACPAPGPDGWGAYPDFLWQHLPDVGTCIEKDGRRLVNMALVGRGVVRVEEGRDPPVVRDDHMQNVSEVLYCALASYPLTIVHNNVRYGFTDRKAWQRSVDRLAALRTQLRFRVRRPVAG